MKKSTEYPLFSFLLICYNQEAYIKEALLSALNQDYLNLEVIVSDDCSSDKTFEIVKQIARDYSGPHKIILNQNSENLGVGANFYKAYTLSSGEWIFMAAGDDVSYPNRCQIIYDVIKNQKNLYAIGTDRQIIDDKGIKHGYNNWNKTIHGASAVWNRRLFSDFEPIPSGLMTEDHLLCFRALLLGNVCHLESPTIKYRVDGTTITSTWTTSYIDKKKYELKKAILMKNIICSEIQDLDLYNTHHSVKYYYELKKLLNERKTKIKEEIESLRLAADILSSNNRQLVWYIFNSSEKRLHSKPFYRIFLAVMKFKISNKILKILKPQKYKNISSGVSKTRRNTEFCCTKYDILAYLDKQFGIL